MFQENFINTDIQILIIKNNLFTQFKQGNFVTIEFFIRRLFWNINILTDIQRLVSSLNY